VLFSQILAIQPVKIPTAVIHERRHYYVYILTNRSQTLYVGVTGNLHRRVWQHKQGHGSSKVCCESRRFS
jgi:hypothetical protein